MREADGERQVLDFGERMSLARTAFGVWYIYGWVSYLYWSLRLKLVVAKQTIWAKYFPAPV